jgi:hypothetical protein
LAIPGKAEIEFPIQDLPGIGGNIRIAAAFYTIAPPRRTID